MPSTQPDELLAQARHWLAQDPDPVTRDELWALLAAADTENGAALDDLADRFSGPLEFGTAGLRGALGAGPNRMNRVVVLRAAAGLAAYLLEHGKESVVIGFDARHNSDVFARDSASVFVGAGLRALVLPRALPTPVLAYAIRHLGVDAGVMVTASHNPPQDNGYKVYLGDGSQIVAPADEEISAHITAVGTLDTVPRPDEGWRVLEDSDVVDGYVTRAAALVLPDAPRDVNVAYTPMHGVGRDIALDCFAAAGFPLPAVVALQGEPDPDFPTVAFPNPEEPGALDLAVALATERGSDVVLANDPDADRVAMAIPVDGTWQRLSGDEVGALLGEHLARTRPYLAGTFANSIVSSTLLGKVAMAHGLRHEETLTGFKWISRVPGLSYGYEEALGYCVDPAGVRDKDGITAALLLAELVASLKAAGRTVPDLLDELAVRYGVHATDQLSIRVDSLDQIARAMRQLRSDPPSSLGGLSVVSMADLTEGVDGLPPTDGLRFLLESDARVIVRPSGTEPKLKCYLEVVVAVGGAAPTDARFTAHSRLDAIRTDLSTVLGMA